ncbi:Uma2 family endonuclease OS=Streptomyces tendae OX=1932 GN=GUR47_16315 PE=4 SV=1 [Streptomyces tendae]
MSALTVSQEPDQNWDDLVRFWEEMDWPEGSKVEIIEGIITVSPAPGLPHNDTSPNISSAACIR